MNIELLDSEPGTALTVTARAALALGSDKARTELAAQVLKSADIKEIKNTAGRDECHSAAMALVRARTNVEKIGKAARDDATKFSKAVIAEEKALLEITMPEENRLLALRNDWDYERAAEKAAAEQKERERVTAIEARIDAIKNFGWLALECRTSAMVDGLIAKLNDGTHCTPSFDEYEEGALKIMAATMDRLIEIRDGKLIEEQERERFKAEQAAKSTRLAAERAALAAERAEQGRIASAAAAEVARERAADAEDLARQRDALVAEQAAWAKEIERRNAEAKALEAVGTFTEPAPYIVEAVEAVKDLAPEYNDRDIRGACINLMYEDYGLMLDDAVARLAAIKWITEPATN